VGIRRNGSTVAIFLASLILIGLVVFNAGAMDAVARKPKPTPVPTAVPFSNPELVTINGYSQDAEEPFISRDGNFLFFDNSNDPTRNPNTDIFWATRIDEVTFQYQGPITGVDTPTALEGVPSMDDNNVFYFVSPRNYVAPDYGTIYSGAFSNGDVPSVELVAGISRRKPNRVNFDCEISADGNTLYFVDSVFKNNQPQKSQITIAHKNGDTFVRDPHSAKIMKHINTGSLQYAPDTSASELELFFTQVSVLPAVFMAERTDKSLPFGKPQKIAAITGFAEAPSISPDGKSLYYHHQDPDGVFRVYRVTRP
jgi:hypothetical protein